jgi:NAD(P)-dependent dehydrogenase (short-subunit alcohol dehydrogenase family)
LLCQQEVDVASPDLTGRRIVVTGSASGMGAASLRGLAALGARVIGLDRTADVGARLAADSGAAFIQCDVADERSVEEAFEAVASQCGGLDMLIHAAGVPGHIPAADTTIHEWQLIMAVNTTGTFLTNRAAYPLLRDSKGGILNFASAAGIRGAAGWAAYSASKGAVLAWTRAVAAEWGKDGVRVNCIAPAIATPMFESVRSAMTEAELAAWDTQLAAAIPLGGRLGDADQDLVPVLAFLSSQECRFITGQVICVDGGQVMVR